MLYTTFLGTIELKRLFLAHHFFLPQHNQATYVNSQVEAMALDQIAHTPVPKGLGLELDLLL